MNKIVPVVIAIIHKDNKFLLTERKNTGEENKVFGKKPLWHFPGGQLEFGEELEVALVREIREETALSIIVHQQLPIYPAIRDHWHGLLIPHLCSVIGKAQVQLNFESTNYGWFTYEEVKGLYKLPLVSEMLDEAVTLLKQSEANML